MRHIGNDQGTMKKNFDISGLLPYESADYGASWATTATITASLTALFTSPQNGDICSLWNSNGAGSGRVYTYMNGAWKYIAVT
jgi:hypothetical protein